MYHLSGSDQKSLHHFFKSHVGISPTGSIVHINTDGKNAFRTFAASLSLLSYFCHYLSHLDLSSNLLPWSGLSFWFCVFTELFGVIFYIISYYMVYSWSFLACLVSFLTWVCSLQYSLCCSLSLVSINICHALCFFLIFAKQIWSKVLLKYPWCLCSTTALKLWNAGTSTYVEWIRNLLPLYNQ